MKRIVTTQLLQLGQLCRQPALGDAVICTCTNVPQAVEPPLQASTASFLAAGVAATGGRRRPKPLLVKHNQSTGVVSAEGSVNVGSVPPAPGGPKVRQHLACFP